MRHSDWYFNCFFLIDDYRSVDFDGDVDVVNNFFDKRFLMDFYLLSNDLMDDGFFDEFFNLNWDLFLFDD